MAQVESQSKASQLVLQHLKQFDLSQSILSEIADRMNAGIIDVKDKNSELEEIVRYVYDGALTVSVKMMSGKSFQLTVQPHIMVGDLQKLIFSRIGIPVECQVLSNGTRVLEPPQFLAELGIRPGNSEISLVRVSEQAAKIVFHANLFDARFPLCDSIRGDEGRNFRYITIKSGYRVQLRGLGSGTLDMVTDMELQEPMFLWLRRWKSSKVPYDWHAALAMAEDLINQVVNDYGTFCVRNGIVCAPELNDLVASFSWVDIPHVESALYRTPRLWRGARLRRAPY